MYLLKIYSWKMLEKRTIIRSLQRPMDFGELHQSLRITKSGQVGKHVWPHHATGDRV